VPNQNAMGISDVSGSNLDVCAKAKRLGYAAAKSVRLYGEEYEAVSDPFLHGGVVALCVKARRDRRIRILRLPSAIILSAVGKSDTETEPQIDTTRVVWARRPGRI
jgi:hypothetical protein